jgi:hypothetical protein
VQHRATLPPLISLRPGRQGRGRSSAGQALDLESLTARLVAELYPEATAEIELHEYRCPVAVAVMEA